MNPPPDSGIWREAVILGREQGYADGDLRGGMTQAHGQADVLTQEQLNPLWTPDGDRADPNKRQVMVDDFADHPIPRVKQMLWWLTNFSGIDPPWRVRVSAQFAAIYTMARIAQALAPHAEIVTNTRGEHLPPLQPGYDITFEFIDQRSPLREDRPIGSRIVTTRQPPTPPGVVIQPQGPPDRSLTAHSIS